MLRRTRPILIALTVLALSAGAALAARGLPAMAPTGLDQPAQASESPDPSESPEASEPAEAQDQQSHDPSESPDVQAPSLQAPAGQADDNATDTHGAVVSQAAQGPTPAGWANHGAYVSAVARGLANPGDPAPDGTNGRLKSTGAGASKSQAGQHGKSPSH